jgi:uncharacterized membrane-anchored protein
VKTLLSRSRAVPADGLVGPIRIDRDPRLLAGRLRRGDIAVIDQVDLDRHTASLLVDKGVVAVVNAAPTVSGRYPSLGAGVLVEAGVAVLDSVGPEVFSSLRDTETMRLVESSLLRGDTVVVTGTRQTRDTVAASLRTAEAGLATQMEAFAASAAEYLRREHALLLEPGTLPPLRTDLSGRDVVVVAPGPEHRDDLLALRRYAKDFKPAVIAVDEAADTARDLGYRPTVVVGDLTQVSDEALREAADIVVTLDRDLTTTGLARVDRMGLSRSTVTTTARPQDVALVLADDADARVIVSAGTDRTLPMMLDSGRTGAAADFVTRLRVGSRLVDAQAVARMHRPRVSGWLLVLLLVVCLVALGVAVWLTPTGQQVVSDLVARVSDSPAEEPPS